MRRLEYTAFRRLGQLPIVERCHLSPNLYQNSLEAIVPAPVSKDRDFAGINLAINLVHEWQIDSRYELYLGWLIRIRLATNDLQTVDTILMYGMTWTDDSAVPLTHEDIIPILQTI